MNFRDIVSSGKKSQRQEMIACLVLDGMSMSTIYSYLSGARTPRLVFQNKICQYVKDTYNVTSTPEELFPEGN